jgi:hypothetical protein
MNLDFVLGVDGQYRNKFGSIVYPQITAGKIGKYYRTNPIKKKIIKLENIIPNIYKKHCYTEFEIQATAYYTLRNYFEDKNRVRGEYTLGKTSRNCYCRCDIAIFNKELSELILIIEVKRNKIELDKSEIQLATYKYFCNNLITISSMEEAEQIVDKIKKVLV